MITAAQEDYIERTHTCRNTFPDTSPRFHRRNRISSETFSSMQRRAISFSSDIL